jgi:hypothetical protein
MLERFAIAPIAALALLAGASSAHAEKLQVSMQNDHNMNCPAISREIETMETVIRYSDEVQDDAEDTGTGITVAKAVGGFLVGSIPGAIGVMAVGGIAGEVAEQKAEDAAALQDIAEQRRSLMIGMFNAKNCIGPVRAAQLERRRDRILAAIEPAAGPSAPAYPRNPYHYND